MRSFPSAAFRRFYVFSQRTTSAAKARHRLLIVWIKQHSPKLKAPGAGPLVIKHRFHSQPFRPLRLNPIPAQEKSVHTDRYGDPLAASFAFGSFLKEKAKCAVGSTNADPSK